MADQKISQLTAGNPAQTADLIPIARNVSGTETNFNITVGSIVSLSTGALPLLNNSTTHDAKNNTGASINSSGNTVTCNNCTFSAGDVGKSITLGLGGIGPASGAVMVSTITGFTSNHTISIATTAGVTNLTGNNILWGTPDAAATNTLISNLSASGGGTIQVSCAGFYMDAMIQTFPNVNIEVLGQPGEGAASQDCVTWFPAGNVTTAVQIGIGTVQQFESPRITNLAVNDLFSQATNGFLVNGASNGIFDATMSRGFNGTGAAAYKFTFGGASTQASTWAMDNVRAYDCTTCVDASLVNVDGPQVSGGEFLVRNTNANFTGQPVGIVGSSVRMSTGTHIIVGQNAGGTQDAVGVKLVNAGTAANIQVKMEAQTVGHGLGIWFTSTATRGMAFVSANGMATAAQFDSGSSNNLLTLLDGGGNNTVLVTDNGTNNNIITQQYTTANAFIPNSFTVSTLPSAAALGLGAMVIVTDALTAGIGTCTGGGSTIMIAVSSGAQWSCH